MSPLVEQILITTVPLLFIVICTLRVTRKKPKTNSVKIQIIENDIANHTRLALKHEFDGDEFLAEGYRQLIKNQKLLLIRLRNQ